MWQPQPCTFSVAVSYSSILTNESTKLQETVLMFIHGVFNMTQQGLYFLVRLIYTLIL